MDTRQVLQIIATLKQVLDNQTTSVGNQILMINQNENLEKDIVIIKNRLKTVEKNSHKPIPFLRYIMIFSFVIYVLFLVWLVILQRL